MSESALESPVPATRLVCSIATGCLCALGLCAAVPALAQEGAAGTSADGSGLGPQQGWRFGLKAGASYSRLRGQLEFADLGRFSFSSDWGFDAGVTVEIPVGTRLSISPEVHVVRKFTEIDLGVERNSLRSKLSVNYVEVPLLAKIYPGDRKGLSTHIDFGPAVAFKLEATREERRAGNVIDVPAGDSVRAVDWSLMFGFGFEFHELFGALTLDVRYAHGLTSIDKSDRGNDAKWTALYLLIGVTF